MAKARTVYSKVRRGTALFQKWNRIQPIAPSEVQGTMLYNRQEVWARDIQKRNPACFPPSPVAKKRCWWYLRRAAAWRRRGRRAAAGWARARAAAGSAGAARRARCRPRPLRTHSVTSALSPRRPTRPYFAFQIQICALDTIQMLQAYRLQSETGWQTLGLLVSHSAKRSIRFIVL